MRTLFAILSFSLLGLLACQQDPAIQTVGVEEFAQIIQDSNVQQLDVRTPEEYAEGHIKGFTMIDVNADSFSNLVDEMLQKDLPVAVYCRGGRRSLIAADILVKKGFTKIYNLEAGYTSWVDAGKEVTPPAK